MKSAFFPVLAAGMAGYLVAKPALLFVDILALIAVAAAVGGMYSQAWGRRAAILLSLAYIGYVSAPQSATGPVEAVLFGCFVLLLFETSQLAARRAAYHMERRAVVMRLVFILITVLFAMLVSSGFYVLGAWVRPFFGVEGWETFFFLLGALGLAVSLALLVRNFLLRRRRER